MNIQNLTEQEVALLIEKMGGVDGVRLFLAGDNVNKNYREEDGVIYFPVIALGLTADDWRERTRADISEYADPIFEMKQFSHPEGTVIELAIIKHTFDSKDMEYEEDLPVYEKAKRLGLKKIRPEDACLIMEKFTEKDLIEMGFDWLLSVHGKAWSEDNGNDTFLSISYAKGEYWLDGDGNPSGLVFNEGLNGGFIYCKRVIKTKAVK